MSDSQTSFFLFFQETVFSDVEVSHDVPYFTKNGSATPTTTSAPTTTSLTTSSVSSSSDDITGTPFPTRIIHLKPLRTTTPMPTSANPLLRFYPQSGSKEDPDTEEEDESKLSCPSPLITEPAGKLSQSRIKVPGLIFILSRAPLSTFYSIFNLIRS